MNLSPALPKDRLARTPWVLFGTIVLLGLLISLVGFWAMRQWEASKLEQEFNKAANDRFVVVAHEVEMGLQLIEATRAFYDASHSVERDEFTVFARTILQSSHSLEALAWLPRVTAEQRPELERETQREGLTNFQIKARTPQGQWAPAPARAEYFPLLFSEPYAGREDLMGFDFTSEPLRFQTLNQARASKALQASGRIRLIQGSASPWGCLVLAPVFTKNPPGQPPATTTPLLGFVLGIFRIRDLFESSLGRITPVGVDVQIMDESASPAELVYFHPSLLRKDRQAVEQLPAPLPALHFERKLPVAGRTWSFQCAPAPGCFIVQRTCLPWMVLVFSLIVTGLVANYALSHARRGMEIARMVETRTAELTRANQELAEEIRRRSLVEEALEASLQAKELLLREVHHRVRNNLQVICSLLQLQTEHLSDPEALRLAREMRNRVRSMALVYEKLNATEQVADLDFGAYARQLTEELCRTWQASKKNIALRFEVEPVRVSLDTAIPCALIVNELVANAFKYAFPTEWFGPGGERPAPALTIKLQPLPGAQILLSVGDNGVGLPPEVGLESHGTFGLQIVTLLVEQLNGHIALERTGGTRFTITFTEQPRGGRS